jgi:hypothetical protein
MLGWETDDPNACSHRRWSSGYCGCGPATGGEFRADLARDRKRRVAMNDRFETCIADEKLARDQLGRQWASFDPGARARCASMSTTGRASSYIELLTCLEMDRSARKLPGHDGTTGIIFTAPERPVNERDGATDPSQSRTGLIAKLPQQPVGAVPAPVVPPPSPQPPLTPPPPTLSAPPLVSPPSQAVPRDEVLRQSVCRSPLGVILPNCR